MEDYSKWTVVFDEETLEFPSFKAAVSYADGRIIGSANLFKEVDPTRRLIQILMASSTIIGTVDGLDSDAATERRHRQDSSA